LRAMAVRPVKAVEWAPRPPWSRAVA
jgi:hypothetical protein